MAPKPKSGIERQCGVCRRTFYKGDHLTRHLRTHNKEKPFHCQTCGKRFSRSDTLLRHTKSHSHQASPPVAAGTADESPGAGEVRMAQGDLSKLGQQAPPLGVLFGLGSASLPNTSEATASEELPPGTLPDLQPDFRGTVIPGFPPPPPISRTPDPWPANFDAADGSSWLLDQDFDIGALNTSLYTTLYEWAHIPEHPPYATAPQAAGEAGVEASPGRQTSDVSYLAPKSHSGQVQGHWLTHLQPNSASNVSRAVSPGVGDGLRVDESYRVTLSRRLRSRACEYSLPSVDHLNLCLRLYFSRFDPIFPILHAPTFRATSKNSLLLLSICSIGCLFVGSKDAAAKGLEIFERLNKAILASWETYLAMDDGNALSMVQAALLGQTFGILSGRPNDLVMVDAFHGTILAWARKVCIPRREQAPARIAGLHGDALDQEWRSWIGKEQQTRLMLGLGIHDVELGYLFQHEPILRHTSMKNNRIANQALFEAPSAERWQALCSQYHDAGHDRLPNLRSWMEGGDQAATTVGRCIKDSSFTAYSVLENIHGSILEARQSNSLTEATRQQTVKVLMSWFSYATTASGDDGDLFCLRILWHLTFMSLCADFDLFEKALGRGGVALVPDSVDIVRTWASSGDAVRCLYHAILLQERFETMRMGSESAIHVPRALFNAALAWMSYFRYNRGGRHDNWTHESSFPEFLCLENINAGLSQLGSVSSRLSTKHSSVVYTLAALLRKIDKWGISESFASIIIEANGDKWDGC